MANPFHSTGSPIVDRMCRLQFTGNVIPAAWYRTIIRDNGKPNLTAIIILSDVVYWYRPVEIRDELTGQLCGFKKEIQSRHFTEKLPAACRSVWNLQKRSCERGS